MAKLEVEIGVKNFDGYKPAFKGAMQAYGILAIKSARWLQHVTGTGGESVEHYLKNDCETCKEIAEFLSEWIDAAEQSVQPTVLTHCPNDGNLLLMGFCDQCKSQYPHSG